MARKSKRRSPVARAKVRQPIAPAAPSSAVQVSPRGGRLGGDQALVRSVEMSLGGSVQVRGRGRNKVWIETGTPAIPLDRVPYFLTDLRQVAITGGLMVVLLVVANYTVIPLLVK